MPVEHGKVREYARATEAPWPGYLDDPHQPDPADVLATVVYWESLSSVFGLPEARTAFAEHGIEADPTRLLSLEQEYLFPGPPPRAGDVLETSLRFDGASAREGRRGGRMVIVRFAVEFRSAGELRAECRYTSAHLGAAAQPATGTRVPTTDVPTAGVQAAGVRSEQRVAPAQDRYQLGAQLPARTFGPVTMTDVVRYQGASGDMNPMHHDDELARAAGYPAAFGVGMLGAGFLATTCCEHYGLDTVRRIRTRFRGLVWRGDTLTTTVTVTGLRVEAGEERVELELSLRSDDGAVVTEGSAEFALPG